MNKKYYYLGFSLMIIYFIFAIVGNVEGTKNYDNEIITVTGDYTLNDWSIFNNCTVVINDGDLDSNDHFEAYNSIFYLNTTGNYDYNFLGKTTKIYNTTLTYNNTMDDITIRGKANINKAYFRVFDRISFMAINYNPNETFNNQNHIIKNSDFNDIDFITTDRTIPLIFKNSTINKIYALYGTEINLFNVNLNLSIVWTGSSGIIKVWKEIEINVKDVLGNYLTSDVCFQNLSNQNMIGSYGQKNYNLSAQKNKIWIIEYILFNNGTGQNQSIEFDIIISNKGYQTIKAPIMIKNTNIINAEMEKNGDINIIVKDTSDIESFNMLNPAYFLVAISLLLTFGYILFGRK